MKHLVSIIMPCYNCAETLEEAFASIYRQGFGEGEFEVVMVNDGSVDNTQVIMDKIASEHDEVTAIRHDRNRGGGAARNTGIRNCRGDLVFCLDSDNIMGDGLIPKLVSCLDQKDADGVVIERRKFFMYGTKDDRGSLYNRIIDITITFRNLFDGSEVVLDNFLFTKKSWSEAGGYPEHHGFDTQCFEVRYLACGHKVFTCPDTIFFHRLSKNQDSYYQRVYQNGEFSKNYFLIYEEVIHLFSETARRVIMDFDFFRGTRAGEKDLNLAMRDCYRSNPEGFFVEDYERYLIPDGLESYVASNTPTGRNDDLFCRALLKAKVGEHDKALGYFDEIIKKGFNSKTLYYCVLRSTVGLSGVGERSGLDAATVSLLNSMQLRRNPISRAKIIILRVINFIPGGQAVLRKFVKLNKPQ